MNKKIVFLVVLLECILAVFIVSFFGHAIEDANKQILCKDIYFTYENGEKIEEDMIEFKLTDSNRTYKLYWKIEAEDTTLQEVEFESSEEMVKVNKYGEVTFLEDISVVITIRAKDGSGKWDKITLAPELGGGEVEIK